jgi:hypothetical protein
VPPTFFRTSAWITWNIVFYNEIWLSCTGLSGVIDTVVTCNNIAVTCTAVSLTPLWHAQRYQWHRCASDSGFIDTAVTCTAVSMTPLCKYDTAVSLDLIFQRLWLYTGKMSFTIYIAFTQKIWGLTNRRFRSRFSSRFRIHIQKGVNPCIRGLGGVVWWIKNQMSKISCQDPFKHAKSLQVMLKNYVHEAPAGILPKVPA